MANTNNRSKILLLVIGILVISNIALIIFIMQKNDGPRQGQRPDRKAYIGNFLKTDIGFDQQQLQAFDTLSDRHRERVGKLFEKIKGSKTEQFKQLVALQFSDSAISQLADNAAMEQKKIEVMQLNHLRNIRGLCKEEQFPKFDSLFGKVLTRNRDGRKKTTN